MNIEKQSHELLAAIIRWNPCCTFLVDAAGRFAAVNKSFAEWSGYANYELENQLLSRVLVSDESLKNSFADQINGLSSKDPTTQVRIQMRPNGDKPVWGTLHTNRFEDKDAILYWCVWEPLKDGTAAAFALAVERTREHTLAMQELRAEIKQISQRDQDEDWIISTIRMARKYPKITIAAAVLAASTLGLNSVLEMAQRLGIIGLPTVPTNPQPQTGLLTDPYQYPQYAGQGISSHKTVSFQLDSGSIVNWGYGDGMRGLGSTGKHSGWVGVQRGYTATAMDDAFRVPYQSTDDRDKRMDRMSGVAAAGELRF